MFSDMVRTTAKSSRGNQKATKFFFAHLPSSAWLFHPTSQRPLSSASIDGSCTIRIICVHLCAFVEQMYQVDKPYPELVQKIAEP